MIQGRSVLVVMLLAALAAGGCSRSSDKEKEEEASASSSGGRGGYAPLIIPFAGQSSSSYSNVGEARPVRRFSGDVGTGSKANISARGGSFFGFGSGS